jgi:hypothetical protein
VRLKDARNIGLTIDLDVITCLVQVQTVVLDPETTGTGNPNTIAGGRDMCIDKRNQCHGGGRGLGGNSKIVNLTTNEDQFTIHGTTI